jgi:hypothetical protein
VKRFSEEIMLKTWTGAMAAMTALAWLLADRRSQN